MKRKPKLPKKIQLKKLPKSGRITKRDPRPKPSEKKAEKASSDSKTSESSSKDASNDSAQGRDSSPVKPAPVPVDNVWERRLEERVSAEREKEQQLKQQQTQQPQQNKGHRKEQRQHAPTESKTDVPYFDEDRATKRGGGVSRRGNPSGTGFSRGGSRAPLNGQKARTEPQPDFGDNFSNMGEFHVEDTMIESKPKRSGKTRGNNGMIHRGNGRKVLLPDPVDVKRTQVEGQEPQSMARIPKEKEQRGRRVIGTRGKLRGGMSSATVRKPTRNVSRQSQLTVHTEPSVVEEAIPTSSLPPTAYGERGAMLKSPVNSSEGCGEEWETASESSGVISKLTTKEATVQPAEAKQPIQPVTKSASSSSVPSQKKSSTTKAENSTSNTTNNSQRQIGPKNAKPASHTSLVRGASSSKNSNGAIKNSSQAKSERVGRSSSASNARDSGNKVSVSTGLNNKDGLAGVDINNASVIVIDDHPATLDVASTTDEGFVEVLSKAAKRQRQLEEQAKAEAEKKKALKEKERQEKLQAKREKAAVRAPGKKAEKQQHRKDKGAKGPVSDSEADASTNNRIVKKEGLIKTVWNSDIVPPTPEESLRGALPVIPSPIARPTPKPISKTAEADVSLTVVAKTPEPVVPKEEATVSPVGDKTQKAKVEAESEDDGTKFLKQNLDKVKEFWPGQQAEFPSTLQTAPNPVPPPVSAAQGPNVAKVRPQPQSTTDVVAPVVQKEPVVQQQANMNNPKRMAAPSPVQAVPQAQGQNAGPMFPNQNAHYQPLMQAPSPFGGITMPPYSVMFNGDVMHPATTNSPPAQSLFAPIPFNAHPNQRPVPQSVPPPSRGSAASSNFEVGPFFPAPNIGPTWSTSELTTPPPAAPQPPNIGPTWSTSELTTPPPAAPQRFFNSAAAYSVPPPNKGCPPPVAQAQRPNFNQPPPPHMHPFGMQTGLEFANKQQAQRMQGPPQPLHNFGNNFPAPHPPQPPNYRYGPHPTAMFGNDAVWSANPKDTLPAQPQSYGLFQKPPPNVPTSGYAPMMPGRNDRWNYSQRGAYSQPQQQQHQYHHAKENVFSEQQNGRTSVASTSSGANNKAAGKA
uniref:BAT2_N domain-containing protein n=1 Tax=Steinernema glaseri TaxID=37863 RepID=A0A1I8A928_9BILA